MEKLRGREEDRPDIIQNRQSLMERERDGEHAGKEGGKDFKNKLAVLSHICCALMTSFGQRRRRRSLM